MAIGWRNGSGAGVVCLLLGGFAAHSAAAESAPHTLEHARQLFAEARDLEQSSQWPQAVARLDQALGIKETPGLRFHLAYCQEQAGELAEALANYQRAAALLADGTEAPDVARLLEPARRSVDQRLPRVTLAVNRRVARPALEVDGHTTRFARLLRLNPGSHRIVVSAPGYQTSQRDIELAERDQTTVEVRLEPAAVPQLVRLPTPARSSDEARDRMRTAVLVGETTFTLALLGVAFGATAARSSVDRSAPDPWSFWQVAGFSGAGVGVVATVCTYWLWPTRASKRGLRVGPDLRARGLIWTVSGTL
jgi:hypothetical protein